MIRLIIEVIRTSNSNNVPSRKLVFGRKGVFFCISFCISFCEDGFLSSFVGWVASTIFGVVRLRTV